MRSSKISIRVLMLLFCAILIHGSGAVVWASSKEAGQGANKAAKLNTVFYTNEKRGYPLYALSVDFKKTGKLAKKNTFSGSFIIQKKLLKYENDVFIILLYSNGDRVQKGREEGKREDERQESYYKD